MPVGDVQALYRVTSLTSVTLDFIRSVQTTAFDASPAFTNQSVTAGIDHEIRRNIVLNLALERGMADYWDSARDDTLTQGRIGVSYRQNRHVQWLAGYQSQKRDSNFNLADFSENRFTLGTRIHF